MFSDISVRRFVHLLHGMRGSCSSTGSADLMREYVPPGSSTCTRDTGIWWFGRAECNRDIETGVCLIVVAEPIPGS